MSKGLASFKLINEMKRNAIIDENGFMVPIEDQKPQQETIEDLNESSIVEDDNRRSKSMRKGSTMNERTKSPRKLTAPKLQGWEMREQKRKQSLRAKGDDPSHNWKMLSETIGFNANRDSIVEEGDLGKNGKDTSSTGSDTFEEQIIERPRGARSRTRSVSPRKRTRSPTKKLEAIKRRLSITSTERNEDSPKNNEDLIQENEDRMDISSPEN